MRNIIHSRQDLCVGCNRCARECPMEAANVSYVDENDNIKVHVDHEKCIACGACLSVCKHQARYYTDDLQSFIDAISAGEQISLIVAPSIRTNFSKWRQIIQYFRNLGVNTIYDISLGADICTWAYLRYMESNPDHPLISQPCPAVVSYCEIYKPELLANLAPLHSPMGCIATYMRKYEGVTGKIAALSPCIAKANEFEEIGTIQYNITFEKLAEYFEAHQVILPEEEADFNHPSTLLGVLYPMPGGLQETINFVSAHRYRIDRAEGSNLYDHLNIYSATKPQFLPPLFDVLNCAKGCNGGPGCIKSVNPFRTLSVMEDSRKLIEKEGALATYRKEYENFDKRLDFTDFLRTYNTSHVKLAKVTQDEIDNAFVLLDKDTFEKQNFDCGACGSATCYDMAKQIALGLNIPLNCIVKSREEALLGAQAKSDFLSRMSHEIRTPMNAIIGMTKIAENSNNLERIQHCLNNITISSNHLLALLNDILDMSKIEANKFELDNSAFDIENMLMKVSNIISSKCAQKNLQLRIMIGVGVRQFYFGDELRLSQVLTNLLGNAIKFTPENGRITLSVWLESINEDLHTLRFSVSDTGIGITEEQISRLFTVFEQADTSITQRFGGSGLGLAISKNIVEAMDGKIWVTSEVGRGSNFIFNVFLKHDKQRPEYPQLNELTRDNLQILVVHEDLKTCNYLRQVFNKFNLKADIARPTANLDSIINPSDSSSKVYDVIFIDYRYLASQDIAAFINNHPNFDANSIVIMSTFLEWNNIANELNKLNIHHHVSDSNFPSLLLNSIVEVVGGPTNKAADSYYNLECPDFSRITLLLAEDIPINREIFMSLLENTNIQIDIAENGEVAVAKFEMNPSRYDIIVMDIQMPLMNGFQATLSIRALPFERAKTIPIIAMTANAFKEDINNCLAAGMNDHLSKPIDVSALLEKIAHYTQEKPSKE